MKKIVIALIGIVFFPLAAKANLGNWIAYSSKYMQQTWLADPVLKKIRLPQVLSLNEGSQVVGGGCSGSGHVTGSNWCPSTWTIMLTTGQLNHFYRQYGPAAVLYVVAHEYSHAIQTAYNINLPKPQHELQADCFAGMFIGARAKALGIDNNDVVAMSHAAYSIGGSPTHGSPSQRSYAVLSGLGVYKGSCNPKDIKKLAQWKPNSQYLTPLRTRSGLKGINANQTPYPKLFKDVLGIK